MSKYAQKKIFFARKGANRLGSITFVWKFQLLKEFTVSPNVIYTSLGQK